MAFLSKEQAHYEAERLAYHIRKYGVKVVIDLMPGAGGGHWGVDTFWGAMAHHIASKRSQGSTPFYKLVRKGRPDVPGPLCNIYGGWDLVARIVTMGLANHSGKGGPWEISGFQIPKDNGRYYFLGTEFEGGIDPNNDWTPEYRAFMGAVNAGKIDYIRELRARKGFRGVIEDTALCEHNSWARPRGRKPDRAGYTQASGIEEMRNARRRLNTSTPANEPATPPKEANNMPDVLWTFFFINGVHHVVNNVTGTYAKVPLDQVDRFTKWVESRGAKWDWHESADKKSREVRPEDLAFVAPNGKFVWGQGQA